MRLRFQLFNVKIENDVYLATHLFKYNYVKLNEDKYQSLFSIQTFPSRHLPA